jgi:hypothetical protein
MCSSLQTADGAARRLPIIPGLISSGKMGRQAQREAKEAEKQAKAAAEAELKSLQDTTVFNTKELKALNRRFKYIVGLRKKTGNVEPTYDKLDNCITRAEFMGMPEMVTKHNYCRVC